MSGHSKWSTIKRQKGITDAKRGVAFTKAGNAIMLAAREAGPNPDVNFKLRLAIEAAKNLNMPKENIERAIARGIGAGKDVATFEEIVYEGFGPGGVAIMVEAVTDNRTRTAQEIRSIFERNGGHLAGPGAVQHIFKPIGEINVSLAGVDEDAFLLTAADCGAEDVEITGSEATVYCQPNELEKVRQELLNRGLKVVGAQLSKRPISTLPITDEKQASLVLSLVNKLEDLNDVQKVHANFDIPEDIIERNTA